MCDSGLLAMRLQAAGTLFVVRQGADELQADELQADELQADELQADGTRSVPATLGACYFG